MLSSHALLRDMKMMTRNVCGGCSQPKRSRSHFFSYHSQGTNRPPNRPPDEPQQHDPTAAAVAAAGCAHHQTRRRDNQTSDAHTRGKQPRPSDTHASKPLSGGLVFVQAPRPSFVFHLLPRDTPPRAHHPTAVTACAKFSGRENYRLVAVGARGDLPDEIKSRECVEERTTELRHLE